MALSEMAYPEIDKYDTPVEGIHRLFIPNDAPEYAPDFWNEFSSCFNCVSYALRIPELGRVAMPGQLLWSRGELLALSEYNIVSMRNLIVASGLEEVRLEDINFERDHVIHASFRENSDCLRGSFHVSSIDRDGECSSKDGGDPVERCTLDTIVNPKYNKPVGYFRVLNQGLHYYPRWEASIK